MQRWTKTSEPHGPDLSPVWCSCGMCLDSVWAEDPQTEPGYHAECYAVQVAAIEELQEDIRREEEEDVYDPNNYGASLYGDPY